MLRFENLLLFDDESGVNLLKGHLLVNKSFKVFLSVNILEGTLFYLSDRNSIDRFSSNLGTFQFFLREVDFCLSARTKFLDKQIHTVGMLVTIDRFHFAFLCPDHYFNFYFLNSMV